MDSTIKLDHLYRITDETGILQHSTYHIPDRHFGYTTDDNSRVLIVTLALSELTSPNDLGTSKSLNSLAEIYLSFIHYAHTEAGYWRNFMDYTRHFIDREVSQDCYGRCMLACSYAISRSIPGISELAFEIFQRGLNYIDSLISPRAIAYTIISLIRYLEYSSQNDKFISGNVVKLSEKLVTLYKAHIDDGWYWFENILTYCNGILPHAMLSSGNFMGRKKQIQIGIESLSFLLDNLMINGYLEIIGNKGWWVKNGKKATYDQQCIDAASILWACSEAYRITGDNTFKEAAKLCWNWFWGENSLNVSLYNEETGGCYDGLTPYGANRNQGAESLLAFLLSYLGIRQLEPDKSPQIEVSAKSNFELLPRGR